MITQIYSNQNLFIVTKIEYFIPKLNEIKNYNLNKKIRGGG